MKITTTPTSIATAHSRYTRVVFEEKETPILRERGEETVLVIGKPKVITRRTFRTLVRNCIRTAKNNKLEHLALSFEEIITAPLLKEFSREEALKTFAENSTIAHYEFARYKTVRKEKLIQEILIAGIESPNDKKAISEGVLVGTYVNHARDLANTPGGDMTPQVLAKEVQNLAKGSRVSVKVLGKREIEKLKMGALLGVSRGSTEDPRFIIMEYWGAGKPTASSIKKQSGKTKTGGKTIVEHNPVVFVGKGITFDTGGLNLKPSDSVLDMHMDMSGGACVAAAIVAASKLGLKKNIIALIPAAENMVSGESYRPGDVLVTMSGKTVDVLNTDAEGRLVLADALTYAERYNPRLVIDVATLTGAALVALGLHASAIMTKDLTLESQLREYGEESGDYVWPLPLWDEYKQYTKGVHGDIANIPSSSARYGGSINGGMFLSHFTEKYLWGHIDMAPRMTSAPGDYLAKGATGEPVRLLLTIASKY